MAGARKLEELAVWTSSRVLVKQIYDITRSQEVRRDLVFCDQIRRAAVSVTANIAEGFGRVSDKEFARYLEIARGSLIETQSLIYVAVDVGYLDPDTFDELLKSTTALIAQLTAFGKYLRPGIAP